MSDKAALVAGGALVGAAVAAALLWERRDKIAAVRLAASAAPATETEPNGSTSDSDSKDMTRAQVAEYIHSPATPWWVAPMQRWVVDGPPECHVSAHAAPQLTRVVNVPRFGKTMRVAHFSLDPSLAYLNHGGYGAALRDALEAQDKYRRAMEASPIRFMEDEVIQLLAHALRDVADFVGARPQDMAFVTNATEGVNTVLRSLHLRPGDGVVCLDVGYSSIISALDWLCKSQGAKLYVLHVALPFRKDEFLDSFRRFVSSIPRLRLAVLDHISSTPSILFPVAQMASICHERDALVLVDGAHTVGNAKLAVPELQVDFYTSNLHKWCCTPKGAAFLWVDPKHQPWVRPLAFSHGFARGFSSEFLWQATRDMTPYLATPVALRWMRIVGASAIRAHNHGLVCKAAQLLAGAWGTEVLVGADPDVEYALACVRLPAAARAVSERRGSGEGGAARWLTHVLRDRGVEVVVFAYGGALYVRISAQVYNELSDYERLAAEVLQVGKEG